MLDISNNQANLFHVLTSISETIINFVVEAAQIITIKICIYLIETEKKLYCAIFLQFK